MATKMLKKEIEAFQNRIKTLGNNIKLSGVEWNDSKYFELQEQVREVASASKKVISSGTKLCETVDKFDKIAYDNY